MFAALEPHLTKPNDCRAHSARVRKGSSRRNLGWEKKSIQVKWT